MSSGNGGGGQPQGTYFQNLRQQPQAYGGDPMYDVPGEWSEQPPPGPTIPGTVPGSGVSQNPPAGTPGTPPTSATPPAGTPSGAPSGGPYGGIFQPGGPPYQGVGIQRPGNWYSVPFLQTYGGQPAPFSDLTAQILNAMQMQHGGLGRFGSNAASRYSFQGGIQQNRPDANPWGQPIQPYQWQPQWNPPVANPPPATGTPPSQGTPPGQPPSQGTPPGQPPSGTVDHAANFRALLAEDPRLAQEYRVRSGDTINWWQKNGLSMFGGDQDRMNAFINQSSPQSSNAAPLSMDEMRRLNQLAGIRSPF